MKALNASTILPANCRVSSCYGSCISPIVNGYNISTVVILDRNPPCNSSFLGLYVYAFVGQILAAGSRAGLF